MATTHAHELGYYANPDEARSDTQRTQHAKVAAALGTIALLMAVMVGAFYVMVGDVVAPGQEPLESPGKYVPMTK